MGRKKKVALKTDLVSSVAADNHNGPLKVDSPFDVGIFNAEDFLTANPKVSILSLNLLKSLYDLTKSHESTSTSSLDNPLNLETEQLKAPLTKAVKKKKKKHGIAISKTEAPVPNLIVEDFDEDQIWEELELQNRLMYDNLVTSVSKLLAYKDKSLGVADQEDSDVLSVSDENEDDIQQGRIDGAGAGEENLENESDSDFFESDEKYAKKKKKESDQKQYKRSIVDDKFFSLAQMTEHIEQLEAEMEQAEAKRSNPNKDDDEEDASSSDGEDSIDLFEDVPSESEGDDENKEESKKYFYEDFFDPPPALDMDSKDPVEEEDNVDDSSKKKFVRFEDEEKEDDEEEEGPNNFNFEEEEDDNGGEEDPDEDVDELPFGKKANETLSTFEKKQRKIEENIQEMENQAMEPKSWHLLGESAADTRPENALLEEHLIYDHLVRPAPEITVETTLKLEDVIKQRIKDGAFDDVQRKVRPVEDPREYKKRLVLDAEKSKSSLAEIYEKEYLEQKEVEDGAQIDEKEPEEHVQIRKELHSLFQKLDALSNFHFTPKTPTAEIKIVTNTPSISVEETAAASISDANMLAPQEIEERAKGAMKGTNERTSTDKKRERRRKKKRQHMKRLEQEERARLKGLDLKNIKLAKGIVKSQRAKDTAHDSYSTNQQTGKELKSSKAFFAKLQEGANAHIDKISKRKLVPKNNQNVNLSAKRFKL